MDNDRGQNDKMQEKAARPPVVVVMGHVDHGKTKILDWYRKTKVVESESGGITQHIGAYQVTVPAREPSSRAERGISGKEILHLPSGRIQDDFAAKSRTITFIDTPGHEAFSKLRARGANIADIAVLVVAADEGVKPQTKEAIDIINQNKLPFVVALNKIDKPEANVERVKQELAKCEVLVESYGGKIPSVEISAKEGSNMDDLLDVILLMADLEDFSANYAKLGEGVVIEAHRDPRRGISATLLVRDGILSKNHFFVIGRNQETFKILENFLGRPIEQADPSTPAMVAGLSHLPAAGDAFHSFETKKAADEFVSGLAPEEASSARSAAGAEDGIPVFNIILKADVAGSKETLEGMIAGIKSGAITLRIIQSGVGDIGESDVKTAQATGRVTIVGFKVGIDSSAKKLADDANVRLISGDVIYEVFDALKKEIEDRIPAEVIRTTLGKIKILKIFKRNGAKSVVGGRVEEGAVKQGARAIIMRNKERVGEGAVLELQRNKVPAPEVSQGSECGILFETKTEVQEGDVLEIISEEITKRTL